jgi:hypothetical protein
LKAIRLFAITATLEVAVGIFRALVQAEAKAEGATSA